MNADHGKNAGASGLDFGTWAEIVRVRRVPHISILRCGN